MDAINLRRLAHGILRACVRVARTVQLPLERADVQAAGAQLEVVRLAHAHQLRPGQLRRRKRAGHEVDGEIEQQPLVPRGVQQPRLHDHVDVAGDEAGRDRRLLVRLTDAAAEQADEQFVERILWVAV